MFRPGAIIIIGCAHWVAVQAWALHIKKEDARLDTAQEQINRTVEKGLEMYTSNSQKDRGSEPWPFLHRLAWI